MEYRYLGKSGLQVSAISFGTWITITDQMGEEGAYECLDAAFQAGVNFFDTAESYGHGESESLLGRIIKRAGWKRSDLVIATKIFWGGMGVNERGLSRKHIIEGTDASLNRLGLTNVDLIFCHRPDIRTPMEETVRAMNYLIDQGKAYYWGTSEWNAKQIMEAYGIARREHLIPPLMEQSLYNMLARDRIERELKPLYEEIGLGATIFSPLSGGLLTGKYNEAVPEGTRATMKEYEWLLHDRFHSDEAKANIEKVRQLMPVAEKLDCTMAQVALAWCLKNSDVNSVITGASRPDHVATNLKALEVVSLLDADIMAEIEDILDNAPKSAHDFR